MLFQILIILTGELIVFFLLSRVMTEALFVLFLLIFRARSVAMSLILLLQFPGTVVHELAHLFTAGILGVQAGKLTLTPEILKNRDIQTGGVTIAESDPFRRYAISLAPVVWGIVILTAIAYFLPEKMNWSDWSNWKIVAIGYLLFAVSNTMFPSPQDLSGFLPFAIALGIFAAAFYYLGLRIALTGPALALATRIAGTLAKSLGVVIVVNTAIFTVSRLLTTIVVRIRRAGK
jgi:hypothetical protein